MFVGVLGSACAGKRTVIDYLTSRGFLELAISSSSSSELSPKPAETPHATPSSQHVAFESATTLLDFVTRNWRTNYVTLFFNGDDAALLEISVRPFFLMLMVDAPILQRWRRSQLVGFNLPSTC